MVHWFAIIAFPWGDCSVKIVQNYYGSGIPALEIERGVVMWLDGIVAGCLEVVWRVDGDSS